ncbi:interferon-inducible GTPase 5-like isoform 1-T2 [Odontesthes bonariensis]|uniref:interferon-inducible GTPase 5-like isoform X1 n=1 Tax=Odontesthes bonariensis TaxID=219752 RepID=UPI003F58F6C4
MAELIDPEVKQQIEQLMVDDPPAAAEMIKNYVENKNNIPLNIGVTGECGSGKSSFVNAFRGINNNAEGAAPTGCVETTMDIKPYRHPNFPNVVLWDLPGIGTTKFPAEKYLKYVEFEKFDFFIIISDTRFRENDVKLAKEIQKMGKKFYFVRSKIDNDLRGEERGQRDFYPERTLSKIRENCIQGLQKEGFKSPQVFLLSCFDLHLYDFSLLHETLERELPDHKKHALLLAMPNINQEIINKKKEAFQADIKYYATASAAVAAVPVPGLSVAVDLSLMVTVVTQYVGGFGLDESSLRRLAATSGVPFEDLTAVLKSELAKSNITKDLIIRLLIQLSSISALMAAEEGSRFIPFLGIPIAMALSFTATYRALTFFLDTLADEAQKVFIRALGLNTTV